MYFPPYVIRFIFWPVLLAKFLELALAGFAGQGHGCLCADSEDLDQ
jgi:hypothetical protein